MAMLLESSTGFEMGWRGRTGNRKKKTNFLGGGAIDFIMHLFGPISSLTVKETNVCSVFSG